MTRRRCRSLRARLVLFITAALVVVCAAMAVTTVLVQRAHLLDELDQRVRDAAARSQGGLERRTGSATDLGFLNERGQPTGTIAARLTDGEVVAAERVTADGRQQVLTAAQRAALAGIIADGTLHTRTIPGLGTYRIAAAEGDGPAVVAGLPMDDVQDSLHDVIATQAVIGSIGLAASGAICAIFIGRQLRPLGRVAATAADTDLATEAGQVGAALNHLIDRMESALAGRQRSEERMRRFLADASHELRTPLASIAGYAELMDRGAAMIEPQQAWRRVSAQSARMTGLVEDLLLLARLDEGRPLQAVEVNLATLVAEAVWDARAAGGDHDWRLALRLDEPAMVTGDPARLTQVLANLLANARVHTPPGTRITVAVEATRASCVIRVRDDGPGLPPGLLPSVFERFTRADASRTRGKGGGSGLGLAIAAAITQAHGGRIDVESEPGRTEFAVTLPCVAGGGGAASPAAGSGGSADGVHSASATGSADGADSTPAARTTPTSD